MDKFLGIVNFLGANGAGRSNASNSTADASWLTEALAWLGDAVVKIATVVWGWLITIFYFVVKWCLNLIDLLQMFIEKLVGIDVYNQEGGLSAVKDIKDTDIIIRFISNETVIKIFRTIMVLGLILLIIFSILALIKQNYQSAITDGADGAKKTPRDVLKYAGRAIFMCLLVPFLLVFGILGSNAVLASICNSIKGDNDLTIGGLIFTASAYEANKFREYASDGLRVPITTSSASEVVYPADYSNKQEMQELFYKLAKGTVYISAISDDATFKEWVKNYTWLNELELEDVQVDANQLMGSSDFKQFISDFGNFYKYYFDEEPLSEFNMFSNIIKSVYSSNWTNNRKYVNVTFDFSSTYITQNEIVFSTRATADEPVPKEYHAKIIVNSESYDDYESFAPIELEYYVMADLIDYAIEQNKTFYYVNASNDAIKWSDIVLNEKKPDETINIEEYNNEFLITKSVGDTGAVYNGKSYANENLGNQTLEDYAKGHYGQTASLVADSAFIVRYYNGVTRLYWSETGATSEDDGATYIICIKDTEGNFIPVTQTTTKFRSSFLADDYGGPIVARGIFQEEGLIPKDYCLPTSISEQVVDDDGNELIGFERNSPFSISDTYQADSNFATGMSSFCGTITKFIDSPLFDALGAIASGVNSAYQSWEQSVLSNISAELNETGDGEDLLINPNISGFTYGTNAENKKTVTFYDYNGRKITAGSEYQEADTTEFVIANEKESDVKYKDLGKTAYVLLQKEMFSDIVIPWYFTDATNLPSLISSIIDNDNLNMDGYSFLLAKYTYDNVKLNLTKTDGTSEVYRMLLNFNITEISQVYRGSAVVTSASSGEFIVTDEYPTITSSKIYVEKKANLVVSGGEIYYANGTKFFGKDDAKKLYTNYISNYITDGLTSSIINYLDKSAANKEYKTVVELLSANSSEEAKKKDDFVKSLSDELQDEYKRLTGDVEKFKFLKEHGYEVQRSESSSFRASDFRAGLASMISEYDKTYFSITESSNAGSTTGVIKFYDQNNRELSGQEISYSSKTPVANKVSLRVALVGGANGGSTPSYAVIISNDTEQVKVSVGDDSILISNIKKVFTDALGEDELTNRNVWYYDVSYSLNYYEYKDLDRNVVAVSNVSLGDLNISYKDSGMAGANFSSDNTTHSNFLKIKNNGVYCEALGKYVLTADGMKNYISSKNENSDTSAAKPAITANETDVSGNASLKMMNSKLLSLKTRSEYNNIYTYFSRGNFSWTMLLDFSIHLPTISFDPFQVKFVFRFKLGSAYNYSEKVLYRLQGGMFYLDYNFRESTGIGMRNLYRMGAINPFILIFSTVLVLTIIWRTVWGLIRRIYDIVLLFIILPAVCSTMPMDEGARFTNWRKELVEQVLAAYSVLITLNIYFVLVPIVKDVTSDLITMGDLPTTITGMFSSIATGFTSLGASIKGVGAGLTGAISSVSGEFGQLMSNIGISNFILDSELTTAQQSILGHVNSIVYIMFFLVLTTMLNNGKALIEKILDLTGLKDDTWKDVKGTVGDVTARASKPVRVATNGAKMIAGKVAQGATRFAGMMKGPGGGGFSGLTAGPVNGAQTSNTPPPMGDAPAGTEGALPGGSVQNSGVSVENPNIGAVDSGAGTGTGIGTGVGVEGVGIDAESSTVDASGSAVDYGFATPSGSFGTIDEKYGGDMGSVDADISDLNDMKADEIDSVRNEAVEYGAVNKDGSYMSLNEYDQSVRELKNTIDDARVEGKRLDAERMELQKEGKFNGDAKADWTERNNRNNEKKTKAEQELSELQKYEGSYTTQREKEADIRSQYDNEIDNLEDYKKTKTTNDEAQARLEEDANKAGLTTEDYSRMNDLYKERDGLNEMKNSVDETFDAEEEREGARAEIEKETKRINDEIVAIKSKASKEPNGGVTGYQAESQEKSLQNLGINKTREELKNMTANELRDEIDARYATSQQAIKEEIDESVAKFGSDQDLEKTINSATATADEKASAQAELNMRKDLASKRDQNTKDYANAIQTQMDREAYKAEKGQSASASQQSADKNTTRAENNATADNSATNPNSGKQSTSTRDLDANKQSVNTSGADKQTSNVDSGQKSTDAKTKKGVGKQIKKVVKGTAAATAVMVAPAPAVMAVVGGKLAVKGGKVVRGKISSGNSYLGSHPKAKEFAKTVAITAGLTAVTPIAGVAYATTKFVKSKGGKNVSQAGRMPNGPGGTTPPPMGNPPPPVGNPPPPPPPPGRDKEEIEKMKKEVGKVKRDAQAEISKVKTDSQAKIDELDKKLEKAEKNATDVEVQLKRSNIKHEQAEKRKAQKAESEKGSTGNQAEAEKVQEQISALEKKIAQTEAKTKEAVKSGVEKVDRKVDKVQQDVDFITDYAGGLEDEIKKVKETKKSSGTKQRLYDLYQDASSGGQEMVKNASENLAKHRAETEAKNPLNKNKK